MVTSTDAQQTTPPLILTDSSGTTQTVPPPPPLQEPEPQPQAQTSTSEVQVSENGEKEKEAQIKDLTNKVQQLARRLQFRDVELEALHHQIYTLENPNVTPPVQCTLPVEMFDMIFAQSSAATRLQMAATSSFFRTRYAQWRDVTTLYVARRPVQVRPRATVVPQEYQVRTNVAALGTFYTDNLLSLVRRLPNVRALAMESSQNAVTSYCNRIPLQTGIFHFLPKLEVVKLCNVSENLSLRYSLVELMALPKLRVLHVRELRSSMALPSAGDIVAPLEQLRLSVSLSNPDRLPEMLGAMSSTLKFLDFTPLRAISLPAIGNNGFAATLLPTIVTTCAQITELHLPAVVCRLPSFESLMPSLRSLVHLKRLSVEVIHLAALVDLVATLPVACSHVTVTDLLHIVGEVLHLSTGFRLRVEHLFSEPKYEVVRTECQRVHRKLTIQLGRLRGLQQPTVVRQVTPNVQIVSNANVGSVGLTAGDRRAFLWEGAVLTRDEFLARIGIAPERVPAM